MRTVYVLTVAVIVVCLVGPVQAALVTVGEPIEGGSWAQAFNESGVGQFDFMAVKMLSADAFNDPVFTNFNRAGWTNTQTNNPIYGVAQTTQSTNNMNFNIRFAGAKSDPLQFVFVAFLGDNLLEQASATWSGSGWNIQACDVWPVSSQAQVLSEAVIPEPASLAVWSVLGGLGALWACRRKKRLA